VFVGYLLCYYKYDIKYRKLMKILNDQLPPKERTICIKDGIEVARWNVVLNDDEIEALAKGSSPLMIRPDNLICHTVIVTP
jgi:hypothetical protein